MEKIQVHKGDASWLKAAAVYNILWGAWVVIFPTHFFELTGLSLPTQLTIWQGMGMVIAVFGLGYWIASYSPLTQWPIVLVGLLGKIFGPIGFVFNYLTDKVEPQFGYTLLTNDFIWWIPFFLILKRAYHNGLALS